MSQEIPLSPEDARLWSAWQADCQARGLPVTTGQLPQFQTLYRELVEYNQKVNLTRITGLSDFLVRHLLESLLISPYLPDDFSLIDVGTGAGFPALPLALARPDLQITALESVGKKCAFIEQMKARLNLTNLTVLQGRSEDVGRDPKHRERFNMATARALAPVRTLLELTTPLLEPGGALLAIKGQAWQDEVGEATTALRKLKTRLRGSEPLFDSLPSYVELEKQESRLLIFEKEDHTPPAYPRQAGTPKRKPL